MNNKLKWINAASMDELGFKLLDEHPCPNQTRNLYEVNSKGENLLKAFQTKNKNQIMISKNMILDFLCWYMLNILGHTHVCITKDNSFTGFDHDWLLPEMKQLGSVYTNKASKPQ